MPRLGPRMFREGLLNVFELLDPSVPPSPIPYLLISNEKLTEEETDSVKNALTAARNQGEALSERSTHNAQAWPNSNEGSSIWHRRQRKIDALNQFIQIHNARISPSPILQLPVEILQEIFMHVAAMLVTDELRNIGCGGQVRYYPRIPWAISWVCRLWRDVAIFTPFLWRALPTVNLSDSSWSRHARLRLLRELLRRSKGYTINVTLISDLGPHLGVSLHPAFNLLVEESHRWASLVMKFIQEHGQDFVRGIFSVERNFSSLRVVDLRCLLDKLDPDPINCNLLKVAPSLEYVTMKNISLRLASASSRLRELSWEGGTSPIQMDRCIRAVYSSSATLTDLCLSPKSSGNMLLRPLSLPNLRRLEFDSGKNTSHWFIDHIVVPSLCRLTLKSSFQDDDLCSMAYNLICQSNTSDIYELCISQPNVPTGLGALLSATPLLLYLKITLPHHDDILDLSTRQNGELTLVPFLRSCIFQAGLGRIPVEAITALQTLASTRFTSFIPMPFDHVLRGNIKHSFPDGVTIDFGWRSRSLLSSTQCALHGWPDSENSQSFKAENERLNSILSALRFADDEVPKLTLDRSQVDELDIILRGILDTKITSMGDIMVCRTLSHHL